MTDLDRSVVEHFTQSAERYKWDLPARDDFFMSVFGAISGQNQKVLDLGCGGGERLGGLATFHPDLDLYGCDITPAMIEIASSTRLPGIVFLLADCLASPFSDCTFDAVIVSDVLHHLVSGSKDESRALKLAALHETKRLLAPEGLLLLKEVCVKGRWRADLIYHLSSLLARYHIAAPKLNVHRDVVLNFYTQDDLEDMLSGIGFAVEAKRENREHGLGPWISALFSHADHVWYVLRQSG